MRRIREELLSTDIDLWRKKLLFGGICLLCLLPFVIIYKAAETPYDESLWKLRHFVGIAVTQAIAQATLA